MKINNSTKKKEMTKFMNYLRKLYLDPHSNLAFTSFTRLYEHLTTKSKYDISKVYLKKLLSRIDVYTKHMQRKHKYKRSKIIPFELDFMFAADLIDLSKPPFPSKNDNIRYICIMLDIFSKFVWAYPLKNKSADIMVDMFKQAFEGENPRIPQRIIFDRGQEFRAKKVQEYLNSKGITSIFTNSIKKSSYAERMIREIKDKMFKFLTHNQTMRYIDVLPSIVSGYNNRIHTVTKMKPKEVNNSNALELYRTIYLPQIKNKDICIRKQKAKFEIGSLVRISNPSFVFVKGYHGLYSEKIYKVVAILKDCPIRYKLETLSGESIIGSFYSEEMVLTDIDVKNSYFKIEKILGEKKIRNVTYVLVKWLGYDDKDNQYIKKSDVMDWVKVANK